MDEKLRIATTGAGGRLGSELVRKGCVPLRVDITDHASLRRCLDQVQPDVIINCAAMTNVDACEHAPIRASTINAGGVYHLSQAFPEKKIVQISTDYIFSGDSGPYSELNTPNPISVYGWSKLGGEIVLKNRRNAADLIIRTTVLFDQHTDNFVTVVIKKLLAGETVNLPENLFGSPTYVPHLAKQILAAIDRGASGVLNLAGDRIFSRFELGLLIAHALEVDDTLIQPGPVRGAAPRPLRAGLKMNRAKKMGLPIGNPIKGIHEVINALETMEAG